MSRILLLGDSLSELVFVFIIPLAAFFAVARMTKLDPFRASFWMTVVLVVWGFALNVPAPELLSPPAAGLGGPSSNR